jgi:hypothetical protein
MELENLLFTEFMLGFFCHFLAHGEIETSPNKKLLTAMVGDHRISGV